MLTRRQPAPLSHHPPQASSTDAGVALFGRARLALLVHLFADPERSFHLRELVRLTASSSGVVQRALNRLARAGLISRTVRGNRVLFQADRRAGLYAPLHLLALDLAPSAAHTHRSPRPRKDHAQRAAGRGRRLTRAEHDRHFAFIALTINRWILRHLARTYLEFEGDLVAAIVLGEVAHHNVSSLASLLDYDRERIHAVLGGPAALDAMLPCNAFSISEATGVPRETVRRKAEELVARGWLTRNQKRELFISLKGSRHFAGSNLETANELLAMVDQLRARIFEEDGVMAGDSPHGR